MKKKLLVTMLTLAMAGSLMACGSKEGAAPASETKTETQADAKAENAKAENTKAETEAAKDEAASGEKHLVGVAMPTKDLQRWNQDGANMKTMLEEAGYKVDLQYAEDVVETQVSQIENMITKGVDVLVVAPMLATGGSATAAIHYLRKLGVKNIKLVVLVAAPVGIEAVLSADPDVQIYTCAIDECLNEHAYIVPGLGDAGDRIFGTK